MSLPRPDSLNWFNVWRRRRKAPAYPCLCSGKNGSGGSGVRGSNDTLELAMTAQRWRRVQVVADPLATRKKHKIIIEGEFGRINVEVENLPPPSNPKTRHPASLSAIATLKRLLEPVQLGA